MTDFDEFIAELEDRMRVPSDGDGSLLTDSVLLAAEAAFFSRYKDEVSAYYYGLAAISAMPANATPFEKGLACGMAIILALGDR